MGQGECVCVLSGENTLMFDCGSLNTLDSAGETAWAWLENAGRKEIDALILSHLHEDHANGVEHLILLLLIISEKPYPLQTQQNYWDLANKARSFLLYYLIIKPTSKIDKNKKSSIFT